MNAESSDGALVLAALGGDKGAFGALLDRHRPMLLALCRRSLGDAEQAEEAAQEAALRTLLGLHRLRQADRFGAWLGGIGLNVCRSRLRERARDAWSWEALQGGRLVQEPLDWRPGPEERAEAADLAARVRRAISELPRGQRSAVLLFYLSGLTHSETASELGIEVGAVKTRLHKARAALKRKLRTTWEAEMAVETGQGGELVEMRVADVRMKQSEGDRREKHVVVLEEIGGARNLLLWVGPHEGTAIALELEQVALQRPLTHAFAANVLQAVGGRLREVQISRLAEETFYATAVLEGPEGVRTVDARPSDALALTLIVGAPILVEPAVLVAAEMSDPSKYPEVRASTVGAAEVVALAKERWPGPPWPRFEPSDPR